jgi:micrococcal nuclease
MAAGRYRVRMKRRPWIGMAATLIALLYVAYASKVNPPRQAGPGEPEIKTEFTFESGGPYRVERVVDGDTLVLEDRTRIRLLGVNTPETKVPDLPVDPLGVEASEFMERELTGKAVRLEYDRERLDDYERVLAYVWLGPRLINEELIRKGYSKAVTRHPYSETMKRKFRAAEERAKGDGVGMWKTLAP